MKSFLSPDPPSGPYGSANERLGATLKTMFRDMTAEPMPERLVQLAQALEEAFQRGELSDHRGGLDA